MILIYFLIAVMTPNLFGQEITLSTGLSDDEAKLVTLMPSLATRILETYRESNREQYLDNVFRLQILVGKYDEAITSSNQLREIRGQGTRAAAADVRWIIYARAKSMQLGQRKSFNDAFRQSFRETMMQLDDQTAYRVLWSFGTSRNVLRNLLKNAISPVKNKTAIPMSNAIDVVKAFLAVQAYESFTALIPSVTEEDDQRRYVIAKDLQIKTPDGATICTLVVRPRSNEKYPSLLTFTIYADAESNLNEARRTASNGYAGVVGLTRGKGCSPGKVFPYEYDGADAVALIGWITNQPWSDGQVGMFGGSYSGGTAWEAAKGMPVGLKAIMTGAPVAPGIDVPMEGSVFWNFVYPWPFFVTNTKTLDNTTYNDTARWERLNHEWYTKGRAYRDMEKIDGTPNPIFMKWISHPSYDAYWQSVIPYKDEFSRIKIPVLTTAGYFYGGPGGAIYYFTEHHKYLPDAEHYLLIGPYDHFTAHRGTISPLGTKTITNISGYDLEPAAQFDLGELRYQWFDYALKEKPRPAILADKVNYFVMGANQWRHGSSLSAISSRHLQFYLSPLQAKANSYKLSEKETTEDAFIPQTVNLADRSDGDKPPAGGGIVDQSLDTSNGIKFMSEPIAESVEMSGLFSGELDFTINKKDFDFNVSLYELTTKGDYIQLAPFWVRASYNGHPEVRKLLVPGKRYHLQFQSMRMMAKQIQAGSRIVAVLNVIKESGRQVNYGTGKDVSDETIADARTPLQIKWFSDSFILLPIAHDKGNGN